MVFIRVDVTIDCLVKSAGTTLSGAAVVSVEGTDA